MIQTFAVPPLDDLRVLDLTQVMAGPFCTMILSDLGADVIKIEPPGGDSTRQWPGGIGGDTPGFSAVNRGKRSVAVDLKTAAGVKVIERLTSRADVLVENYRPGTTEKLGIDYRTLRSINPALIYASISGYGQTGPDRAKGGFDLIAQGVSGIMSVTGQPGGPPAKAGVPVTDLAAGLFAVVGILAALQHVRRSGVGQHIDTSLVDAGVALSVWEATELFSGAGIPAPLGSAHRMLAPYQAVRCEDGYITLGAGSDRLFRRLCRLLGKPEWSDAPEFVDTASRLRHRELLAVRIEAITATRPRRHWLDLLEANDIPCGPINDYAQVFADPQVLAREMIAETDHPVLGRVRTPGSPIKFSLTPATVHRRAPLLGEHTADVLTECGFSEEEIAALRHDGAVAARTGEGRQST
jgi:formyl-CoA transferase